MSTEIGVSPVTATTPSSTPTHDKIDRHDYCAPPPRNIAHGRELQPATETPIADDSKECR